MNPFIIDEPTVISFSGGRTSAYMLYRVLEANNGLPDESFVCFANTGKEEEATLQFVHDCETNWTCPISWLEFADVPGKLEVVNFESASRDGKPFDHLTSKRKYLPNPIARFCTSELKILSIDRFMKSKGYKEYETMVGIRADEPRRAAKMKDNKLVPLYHAGIRQEDVQAFWKAQSFDLGLAFRDGVTPLGNCDLCFLKGQKQLLSLIADKPERALWWAQQEEKIQGTFRKDRPKYSVMMKFAEQQTDMFDKEGSVDCFCGD